MELKKIFVASLCMGASLLFLPSCSDWLDVQPSSQFNEEEMFNTEDGFKDALYGVYYTLSGWELYGMEMSWGSLDVMAQYYDMGSGHILYKCKTFDYESANCKKMINGIWIGMYNAIAEVNNLLANLNKKNPEELRYYNYYKGEALALRGLLHFELCRLFGPNYQDDPERIVMPYVTGFGNHTASHESIASIYQKVLKDVNAAIDCLSKDPILKGGLSEEPEPTGAGILPDGFLDNRQNKMNCAAAKALLARVYFSMNDLPQAARYAVEVIDTARLQLVAHEDLTGSTPDRLFSSEIIFGVSWYNKEYFDMANQFFGVPGAYTNQLFRAYNDVLKEGYSATDERRIWFEYEEQNDLTRFLKYKDNGKKYQVGLLRLSEMYLIAAESFFPTDPQRAVTYFNTYALSRKTEGISPDAIPSQDEFNALMALERKREFFGDGQLFFYHKLKKRDIVINSQERVEMNDRISILPLPEDEIKYGHLNH